MMVSAILSGHLPPGSPLPSSRLLSTSLGIARNTVVFAYQQLSSEGYLDSRERSGHFVADDVLSGRMAPNSTPSTQTAPPSAFESRTSVTLAQRLSFNPSTHRHTAKPAH